MTRLIRQRSLIAAIMVSLTFATACGEEVTSTPEAQCRLAFTYQEVSYVPADIPGFQYPGDGLDELQGQYLGRFPETCKDTNVGSGVVGQVEIFAVQGVNPAEAIAVGPDARTTALFVAERVGKASPELVTVMSAIS